MPTFYRVHGVARLYADRRGLSVDVMPGELIYNFVIREVAVGFAEYCHRKKLNPVFVDVEASERKNLLDIAAANRVGRHDDLMLKRFAEGRAYPMRVELAGYYRSDGVDFLKRYRLAFHSDLMDFQSVKSRRAKAYVDLRMAVEAMLKSIVCLRASYGLAGEPLVKKVRSYRHDIERLAADALKGWRVDERILSEIAKCMIAPADIRYQYDAMNFREPETNYYATVGSNAWLKTLDGFAEAGLRRLGEAIGRRQKIVTGNIAIEEMMRETAFPPTGR